jgi:hypothetical protein
LLHCTIEARERGFHCVNEGAETDRRSAVTWHCGEIAKICLIDSPPGFARD